MNEENYDKQHFKHIEMKKCEVFPSLLFFLAKNSPENIQYLSEIIKQVGNSYLYKEEIICVYNMSDLFK